MKYLIDIGHPAHVHYFKNFTRAVMNNGHEVLFTCRDKEVTVSLLEHYNFRYVNLGHPFKSILGKAFGLFYFTFRILVTSLHFKPDMFLNASMYSAIVARLMRKPHISLEDTFNQEQVRLYLPFTNCVLTGDYDHPKLGKKEIRFNGYQELLYLHPNYFKPDKTVLQELGLLENEPFVIIRFVSWNASHDFGHAGISFENKIKAIEKFEKYAKVLISSEAELPLLLKQYQIQIAPFRMHDAMAFASLVIGESFTMVSEASVIGTPAILIHDTKCYYLQDQQNKYGLPFNFSESDEDQKKAIEKGVELLKAPCSKKKWQRRRDILLSEKIDVTAFLVWFIENWPESFRIMKENPDSQLRFK
jgi:uncharacterized protein